MIEVYDAIKDKVDELTLSIHNDFYDSIGGRYFTERAPQETTFPYCVGHLIISLNDDTFTEQLDLITFQFSIYDDDEFSTATIGDIYTKLRALFDNTDLTVANHTSYQVYWQNAAPMWFPEEQVWQYRVDYELEIEQDRV